MDDDNISEEEEDYGMKHYAMSDDEEMAKKKIVTKGQYVDLEISDYDYDSDSDDNDDISRRIRAWSNSLSAIAGRRDIKLQDANKSQKSQTLHLPILSAIVSSYD